MENSNLMNEQRSMSMFTNVDLIIEELGEAYDRALYVGDERECKRLYFEMAKFFVPKRPIKKYNKKKTLQKN